MAVVVLVSVSGSPGVTSTALGLALGWGSRHVVLVEADPVGGSAILAGHFRAGLQHPGTLVELWAAQRQGRLAEVLTEAPLRLADGVDLIPGPAGAAQAATLTGLWPALAAELRALSAMDVDVIVDYGRLGHIASAIPLLGVADRVLIVTRTDLPAVAAVSSRPALPTDAPASLLVIGRGDYTPGQISAQLGLPVAGVLPWAPLEAAMFSHGRPEPTRWPRRPITGLRKSLGALAGQVQAGARERLEELDA